MKPKVVIFDIDGTLSNCDHRRHYVERPNKDKDFKSFYDEACKDTVNLWCKSLNYILAKSDQVDKIIILTGRPSNLFNVTANWLVNNGIFHDTLMMRKEGDHSPDFEVKKKIYEENIKDKYDVLFVVDDRTQVVDMWREQGLTVLQCAKGDY